MLQEAPSSEDRRGLARAVDKAGNTPLHLVASITAETRLPITEALIDAGGNVKASNDLGWYSPAFSPKHTRPVMLTSVATLLSRLLLAGMHCTML